MSYPMLDLIGDRAKLSDAANEWISETADGLGAVYHQASHEIASTVHRGKDLYQAAHKQVAKQVEKVDSAIRHHPYPVTIIVISAGAIIGFFLAKELTKCRKVK